MADTKISDLTAITGADTAADDDFVVVDTSAAQTKRITRDELKSAVLNTGAVTIGGAVSFNAIAQTKAVTAVDVFVYDTSKDSDGGAWRNRTQATSWYNETLNTATRGARKEFPAVAVIVAEAAKVTIYDGDDPDLPMWRVEDYTGLTLTAINAINGSMAVAASTGLILSSYVGDDIGSATLDYTTATTPSIVNNAVNDVAMTVLPNAPIDPATGIQAPTIAVATDGGVSVIRDDGTVVDVTCSTASFTYSFMVSFDGLDLFMGLSASNPQSPGSYVYAFDGVPASDTVITVNTKTGSTISPRAFYSYQTNSLYYDLPLAGSDALYGAPDLYANSVFNGRGKGIVYLDENPTASTEGMVAYTTSTYNTGWMPGDIKGAFLSDTDDTDVTGGTEPDRSVNNNPLIVNGTVTKTAVATGAELVGYSGFSLSNYLEQAYNSDLDFGTGDFSIMGWVKISDTTNNKIFFTRSNPVTLSSNRIICKVNNGLAEMQLASTGFSSTSTVGNGVWNHLVFTRRSGAVECFVNGVLESSAVYTVDLTDTSAESSVGVLNYNKSLNFSSGSLALLRISATAPSPEQIKKIYEDEKFLFQDGAQATLYGASDAVTALAHDQELNLLHVGTSAGRSVFQGLRRVSNTTTAVGTAISASNGLVVEE